MDSLTRRAARDVLALSALPGVGRVRFAALVETFGSAEAALRADAASFAEVAGARAATARATEAPWAQADRLLEGAERAGMTLVLRRGAGWPSRLDHLPDPPPLLFLRGDEGLLDRPLVAVVGARGATAYGRRVAEDVVRVLVRHGAVVASGLARGVDGVAHRSALDRGAPTVAVLGTGADRAYPRAHAGLQRRIAAEGLLVTELPPGTGAAGHHFPLRNRILAALGRAVVVIEAGHRSGALITARRAMELSRDVLAVPGPVYAARSRGANQLLNESAGAVVHPERIPELLPWLESADAPPPVAERPPARLGAEAGRVWGGLDERPRSVDELAGAARLTPARTLAALAALELEGWAGRAPGMRFVRDGPETP